MGKGLYVETETIPMIEAGKEVMFLLGNQAIASAPPTIYIRSLTGLAEVTIKSGKGAGTDSFGSPTTITFNQIGQKERMDIPNGSDDTDNVTVLTVSSGRVMAMIVSPTKVHTEFRTRKTV